jgi:vacuolar-type H+-ATPase subunit H
VAAVDILHLLDQLEEEVASARKVPMGGGVLVDRKRLLELIDQLRVAIPANIRQARDVMQRREQTLAEADAEARNIISSAQQELQRRLSESSLVREAQAEADKLQRESNARALATVREAQQRAEHELLQSREEARRQVAEADQYALAVLTRLDKQMSAFVSNVRQGIEALRTDGQA